MGLEPLFVLGVLLDKAAQFVGIVNRSWSLDTSDGVVVQEAEFEGQSGDHHLHVLDPKSFVLSQVVFNNEVVGRRGQSLGSLLGNQVKLVVIVADVFP